MGHIRTLDEILSAMTSRDARDRELVTKAYNFSKEKHEGQKRYSGDPYFLHTAETAYLIAKLDADAQTIASGLLHDTVEDASVSLETIKETFGDEVAFLVDGVTKLGSIRYRGAKRHIESLRKLFTATAHDIRVLLIKLADRVHNAQTLEHVPAHKRRRIALETLELFAPIADRLGMNLIKTDLEDASFPHAYPEEFEKVRAVMKERKHENESRLEKVEKDLKRELAEAKLRTFRTEARIKGLYSLYRKLERKDWDITQILDILALRVIVPSVAECYAVLGVIHKQWRPVPGKIKDYIAFPKPNGYQSIHTTVYTGDGGALEIQIRTEAMHREAQYGIASHLTYKERLGHATGAYGSGLAWVRQFIPHIGFWRKGTAEPSEARTVPRWIKELAAAHEEVYESDEYLDTLKGDFFSHRVFVFTPKGDVIDLPVDATPIDFAYAIHSEIANHMAGARVNEKMVALDSPLHNGDIVEIVTKPSSKPTRKWYDAAKTSLAKKMIRQALAESEPTTR